MGADMRWLQGMVAKDPKDEEIDLDNLLVNLLHALVEEQKAQNSQGSDGQNK